MAAYHSLVILDDSRPQPQRPETRFIVPDFSVPLDEAAELARIPRDSTVKGLYFTALRLLAERRGLRLARKSYVGLVDYPNLEYAELVLEVARGIYPNEAVREAVRRIGHTAFPALRSSVFGRAVFGVFGDDLVSLFRLVSRGWATSTSHVSARLLETAEDHALIEIADVHALLDTHAFGIFEGIILDRGFEPDVGMHKLSETHAIFRCAWR